MRKLAIAAAVDQVDWPAALFAFRPLLFSGFALDAFMTGAQR